ncbi:type III restriction protein res subunit [Desulfatibacillum aliphaticivorans]|uniref:Type III restriction protein res subunit n=1 Tax=Desulfatibacillum aliphaticivorans TaxID=218208 RepID=B8FBX4_DESAL|nr:DEAD/DEAH box helicase family protein [Desulfatibacillum aliphaticivorans]ACL05179.1 type III restriction protein res subunit [Desulfatibacillum aliphaticivorans]
MNYYDLIKNFKSLLDEINRLKIENSQLRVELGLKPPQSLQASPLVVQTETMGHEDELRVESQSFAVNNSSDSPTKIRLFMSLFKGREDVFAKRWESRKSGTGGYAPACLNQWRPGICGKPKLPCSKCSNTSYAELNETVIESHLRGHAVVGVYPMLQDETCHFLAMDFDKANWEKDVAAVRDVCSEYTIPIAVERSRSGKGGHVWFFFEHPVSAGLARKFGAALLTRTMNKRHDLPFASYDRLFPSQDTMPKGGLGNLIALPLQKAARENANSEFIDEHFRSYSDQWAFLSAIERMSQNRIECLITDLSPGDELGELKIDEEESKPWETKQPQTVLEKSDFPDKLEIVRGNMLFIPKEGMSQRALNRLKRLATFKNPMFYRQQAMRLPTYNYPRVISCSDDTQGYLCLPRGCEPDLVYEIEKLDVSIKIIDKTYAGKRINVEFKGHLRDEQNLALSHLIQHDNGILSGTTAFGKTVVAIKLIAEKKTNTLILVDKISLLTQWKKRLSEFLEINEPLPDESNGRRRKRHIIGQIGGGRNTSCGVIDIAVMQSLSRKGEVKEIVRDYGLIIADECHHASAFTYEQILKKARAKYVYGLSATPVRKDGHQPILFMHCGPIRYRDNPKRQAESRPFDHYVIPRFTSLRTPLGMELKDITIQSLYVEIMESDFRDQQIIGDVLRNHEQNRHCLVLTLRTAHVEKLAKMINEHVPNVISLTGGMGKKGTRKAFDRIAEIPADKPFVLVATGHFIGEGFDEPRLDTLFLAMPISWKGTLQQYAGRLHRLCNSKNEVRIYDYVDIQVPMLERMYQKRLNGYASMGYKAKASEVMDAPIDIIFSKDNFLPVFTQDIIASQKEILIVSPFIRQKRTRQMIHHLNAASGAGVRITIITRPEGDFPEKDHPPYRKALDLLSESGFAIMYKSNIHQKFAIMDQKIVWYGSINLLSYGNAQESMMRIESAHIANELIKSIEDG